MALSYARITVELREVSLQEKPQSMLAASPKATVPVLILADGHVLDESADVMRWAIGHRDPDYWWRDESAAEVVALLEENDGSFKLHLDHYKYWHRFPQHTQLHYRHEGEQFLQKLEQRLLHRRFLIDDKLGYSDVAIFLFVRQFACVDKTWFDQAPYPGVQLWLQSMLNLPLFLGAMARFPAWREGDEPQLFPEPARKAELK